MTDILKETLADLKDWRTWLQLICAVVIAVGVPVCGYASRYLALGW